MSRPVQDRSFEGAYFAYRKLLYIQIPLLFLNLKASSSFIVNRIKFYIIYNMSDICVLYMYMCTCER